MRILSSPKRIAAENDFSDERMRKIFAERLRDLRAELKFTQGDIADMLHVPVSTYANWEQGRREPGVGDIFRLLYVLDITADELFALEAEV